MKEVIEKLFKPTKTYRMGSYYGKHILEKETGDYISETEFIKIMLDFGYNYNERKGTFNCIAV